MCWSCSKGISTCKIHKRKCALAKLGYRPMLYRLCTDCCIELDCMSLPHRRLQINVRNRYRPDQEEIVFNNIHAYFITLSAEDGKEDDDKREEEGGDTEEDRTDTCDVTSGCYSYPSDCFSSPSTCTFYLRWNSSEPGIIKVIKRFLHILSSVRPHPFNVSFKIIIFVLDYSLGTII